jgi:hypothetical protein
MSRRKQQGSAPMIVLAVVIVAAAIGGIGWYVWQHRTIASKPASTITHSPPAYQGNGWSKTVTSGKGGYTITFLDGWHVARDTQSDSFMIGDEQQPEAKTGTPATITSGAFGGDGPSVLFITLNDKGFVTPKGTASDFLLENGKTNPVQGKKYVYVYPADEVEPQSGGIGGGRLQNDRDYTYVFNVGNGKELTVSYSVYASDPRNNIETIDTLVRTIRLNS